MAVGTICYSVMVRLHRHIFSAPPLTSSFLDIFGRDDRLFAYSRRPYRTSWTFCRPRLFVCLGLELLVRYLYLEFACSWQLIFYIPFRFHYVIVLPTELSAASVLIRYWNQTINVALWITIGIVVVVAINLMGAGKRFHLIQVSAFQAHPYTHNIGFYGEAEFIFAQVLMIHFVWPVFDAQYIAPSKLSLSPVS